MSSISGRMALLFVLFFLLVFISTGAMFWGLRSQADDALVINLAGRQRMLVQQMTRLAAELAEDESDRELLILAAGSFQETLQALQTGGVIHYPAQELVVVPAAGDAAIRQQMETVDQVWQEYRSDLDVLLSTKNTGPEYQTAAQSIKRLSPKLLGETDTAVRLIQDRADQRVAWLRLIQMSFSASAFLLLLASGWVVRRSILRPLQSLGRAAERIGQGDLHTAADVEGLSEIRHLSSSFEHMRSRLSESRSELLQLNQTLETRVVQRTRELDALYEVSQEILSRLKLNLVLQSITIKARELLKADIAFVCLLEQDSQRLTLRALSGPQETIRNHSAGVENPFVQSILTEHRARYCQAAGCAAGTASACGILDQAYRASHLASSLWVEGRVIGALCVGSRQEEAFPNDASELLTRLSNAAAVAIENARLYEQAERVATLEERQRLAAAMHDGLAQTIDSLGLFVDQANGELDPESAEQVGQFMNRVLERIRQASSEVRLSIANLQNEPLPPSSLQERLEVIFQEFSSQTPADIQWVCRLPGRLFLPDEDVRLVGGIAREALTNASRYSKASRIELILAASETEVTLSVEDNGCGFDPTFPFEDERKHFGLKILQARAAHLGGRLKIQSAPGQGTCITLTWPVCDPAFSSPDYFRSINEKNTGSTC